MTGWIVVVVRGTIALHRHDGRTDWARPGEVIRMPMIVAQPLIRGREVAIVDQLTPPTREY